MVSLPVVPDEIKVNRKIENIDQASFSIRHKIGSLKTCYFDDIEFVDGKTLIVRTFLPKTKNSVYTVVTETDAAHLVPGAMRVTLSYRLRQRSTSLTGKH